VIEHHIYGNGRGRGDFLQLFLERLVERAANPLVNRFEAGNFRAVAIHLAADLPVVVGPGAANVRSLTGKRAEVGDFFQVFLAVDRLDFDAFLGFGDQLFLKGRALEAGHCFRFPILVGRNRELV